jgi:hypothetical protein
MPILHIRDKDGNFIPIDAIRGDRGKSAYEQAKEGGFAGTEEEFVQILGSLGGINALQLAELDAETAELLAAHIADKNNPHNVLAEQTGAISKHYPTSSDLNTELTKGDNTVTICCYYGDSLNSPYKEGKTACTHGMVITNAHSDQYGTQLCMPTGEDTLYIRRLNGGGISQWVKLADNKGLDALQTEINRVGTDLEALLSAKLNIATGTYEGTNKYGSNNPLTLTFPFVPKVVFISPGKKSSTMPFAWIYGSPIGITAYNNSQIFASNLTWNGNTLTWYTSDGYPAYQYNNSDTTYYWVALG